MNYTPIKADVNQLRDALATGDIARFIGGITAALRSYNGQFPLKFEDDFQRLMFALTLETGITVFPEQPAGVGRIDMLVLTTDIAYIFEYKRDHNAREALEQIEHRRYADNPLIGNRRVVKVGINFDSTTRQITEWLAQE